MEAAGDPGVPPDGGSSDAGSAADLVSDAGRPPVVLAPIFPSDSAWNTPIDQAGVDAKSADYISDMGSATGVTAAWDRDGNGIPYIEVPQNQAAVPIQFELYPRESDPGPYPIPPNAPIDPSGDRHVIVLDRANGHLYELFRAFRSGSGWIADNGAKWNLWSSSPRPLRWTSADAAGLPIFPGLVRYDEVVTGEIRHALRFVVGHSQKGFVAPATHASGTCSTNSSCPPMGLRVRLKANVNISGYSWKVQVILRALKKYGMFAADNGGGASWWISGSPDSRWSYSELLALSGIKGSDFEAVAHGPIQPQ